jgi:hypothetical protein
VNDGEAEDVLLDSGDLAVLVGTVEVEEKAMGEFQDYVSNRYLGR